MFEAALNGHTYKQITLIHLRRVKSAYTGNMPKGIHIILYNVISTILTQTQS